MTIRWKPLRGVLLYPLLIVGGCHTLMTGSPIPLWRLENLAAPVQVLAVSGENLVLRDGRRITLPFITHIPHDNPLFQAAIANGIEVTSAGEAFGLLWLDRNCGNDPTWWRRVRVNLSDLAGALQPEGIDDNAVYPETKAFLEEHQRIDLTEMKSSHDRGHLAIGDGQKMRRVRNALEYAAEQHR